MSAANYVMPMPNKEYDCARGRYAFNEDVSITLCGTGAQTFIWFGLRDGACLGALSGERTMLLFANEILERLAKGASTPPKTPSLGRTADMARGSGVRHGRRR